MMNRTVLASTLSIASSAFAEESSVVKQNLKNMVASVMSAGKDVLSSVNGIMDDECKTNSRADSDRIVIDGMTLIAYTSPSVLSVEKTGDMQYKVTLALRNNSDTVVRLTHLNELSNLQLLDKYGFIGTLEAPLTLQQSDITIPAKAAVKARYTFDNLDETPAILRLYGEEIIVPTVKPSIK